MANSIAPSTGQGYNAGQVTALASQQNAAPQNYVSSNVTFTGSPAGDSLNPASGGTSSEAVVPPLLQQPATRKPQDAAAADAFASAQGSGMAAVALLAASLVVIAAVGVPLTMELNNTRAKTRLKLKREEFEHAIREIDRSAADSTLLWVRELEKRNVDPGVVSLLSAEMNTRWNAFVRAVRTVEEATTGKARPTAKDVAHADVRKAVADNKHVQGTFREMRALDLPIAGPHIEDAIADLHPPDVLPKTKLSPDAAFVTLKYMGMYLEATRAMGRGDGDNLRLFALQSEGKIQNLLRNHEYNARAIALGTWTASRHLEIDRKLNDIHEQAAQRFLHHRLPVHVVGK